MQIILILVSILVGGSLGYYLANLQTDKTLFSSVTVFMAIAGAIVGGIIALFPAEASYFVFIPLAGIIFYLIGWRKFAKHYFQKFYSAGKMILILILNLCLFFWLWAEYPNGILTMLYFSAMSLFLLLFLPKQGKYKEILAALIIFAIYGWLLSFLTNNLLLVYYTGPIQYNGFGITITLLYSLLFFVFAKSLKFRYKSIEQRNLYPIKDFLMDSRRWADYRKKYPSEVVEKRHAKMIQAYNKVLTARFGLDILHPDMLELDKMKTKIQLRALKVFRR